ncbi:hypothetical protein QBC47DRAFT_347704 [Echria macrotheca]|uniref:Uncharacterized protein n=1 Tax=Echria macrotheca TaxID=438768 RepID=A0AAJ0F9Z9_9PEZI|nr:hypothetical protein QBC47DRAFT_347704 [Echria macrotheca]
MLLVIHIAILTTWIAIAISLSAMRSCSGQRVYSPAQEALRFEAHVWEPSGASNPLYAGKPTEARDKAWTELLQYSSLRFTVEELEMIGPTRKDEGVKLPDGGYLGTLMVFHELHCVKHLRFYLYAAHYFPELTAEQTKARLVHLDHCLDILRVGAMCRGDTAPLTMRWGRSQPRPLANFSSAHSCVNWDSLNGWAQKRAVTHLFDPGYLRHPVLGNVFEGPDAELIGLIGAVEVP